MIKILFVCHGNICRSPMAEFLMKDMAEKRGMAEEFQIHSAATSAEEIGNPVHPGTRKKLAEHGIHTEGKYAVQIKRSDYNAYDYIIAMDQRNLRNIHSIIGTDAEHKVSCLLDFTGSRRDIRDPWYTGNFDETFSDVQEGLEALFIYLAEHEQPNTY